MIAVCWSSYPLVHSPRNLHSNLDKSQAYLKLLLCEIALRNQYIVPLQCLGGLFADKRVSTGIIVTGACWNYNWKLQ